MASQVHLNNCFPAPPSHDRIVTRIAMSVQREKASDIFSSSTALGLSRFTGPSLAIPLFLCLAWILSSCASFLGYPTYYDATTYKNLTDIKAEILFLYDTFATDSIDEAQITAARLKLAQAYEYEKGKGEKKNRETREQLELIQGIL